MSFNNAQILYPEVLRTIAAGSISVTYAGVGTALLHPARLYYLVNNTDVLLTFSWDGVHDHFVVPATSYMLFDVTSNKTSTGGSLMIAQLTRTYVKGSPSTGSVYLTTFFGDSGLGMY